MRNDFSFSLQTLGVCAHACNKEMNRRGKVRGKRNEREGEKGNRSAKEGVGGKRKVRVEKGVKLRRGRT